MTVTVHWNKPRTVYVYDYLPLLTDNWHDGGGLIVITAGDPVPLIRVHQEEFQAAAKRRDGVSPEIEPIPDPVATYETGPGPDVLHVFPDAGCC